MCCDTLPDTSEEIADRKLNVFTSGRCLDSKKIYGNTLWINGVAYCTHTSATELIHLIFSGVRRRNVVSAQPSFCCLFQLVLSSGDAMGFMSDVSYQRTRIMLRRAYSQIERRSLLADYQVYHRERFNNGRTYSQHA